MDKNKNTKIEADGLMKLSVSFLKKEGFLKGLISGIVVDRCGGVENQYHITVSTINEDDKYVYFTYSSRQPGGEFKDLEYKVSLVTTACHYGRGRRFWFACPLIVNGKDCGRRVGVLYKSGDYFGCRHCYNLTYKSRNQSGPFKRFGVVDGLLLSPAMWDPRWWTYKGKPTKRYLRFDKKQKKAQALLDALNERGEAGLKRMEEKVAKLMPKINGSSVDKTPDGDLKC